MIRWGLLKTIVFVMLGALSSQIAHAQTSDTPAVEPPRQASSYSDTRLRSFALAALNVERIRNLYLPKFEAATTPEQQQEVGKAATDEMVQAIEGEGMTMGQYREISTQARQNPELAKRVQERVRDAATK